MSPRPLSDDPLDLPRPARKAKSPQRASGPVRPLLWVYVWGLRLGAVAVFVLLLAGACIGAGLIPQIPLLGRLGLMVLAVPLSAVPALPFLVAAEALDVLLNGERLLAQIRDNGRVRS